MPLKWIFYIFLIMGAIQIVFMVFSVVVELFNKDELGLSYTNYTMVEVPGITVGKLLESNENRTFSSDLVNIGYFQNLLDKGFIKINNKKLSENSKIYITKKGKKEFKYIYDKVARDQKLMKEQKKEEKDRELARKKEEKDRELARKKEENSQSLVDDIVDVSSILLENIIEGENAQRVKDVKLGTCPGKTLDEMAKGFMGSHSWSSGETEDGNIYVNLKGDISYMEKKVSAVIQFKFNDENTHFQFHALEFNEIPQNNLMAMSLLDKMCGQESSNEQDYPSEVESSEL